MTNPIPTAPSRAEGDEHVSLDQLLDLQRRAGIPYLPTQLTYNARLAMSGEGPMAYDWEDKPHRVVYALCQAIEFQASQSTETTKAGIINWKMEAERANRLLAESEHRVQAMLDTVRAETVAETVEKCAKVVGTMPLSILQFYDRPNSPPGNAYRPTTFADAAVMVRTLAPRHQRSGGER